MSFFIISKCQAQRETEIRLRIRPRLHVHPLLRVRHRVRLLRVRQNCWFHRSDVIKEAVWWSSPKFPPTVQNVYKSVQLFDQRKAPWQTNIYNTCIFSIVFYVLFCINFRKYTSWCCAAVWVLQAQTKRPQLTVNLVLLFSYSVSNIWIVVYSYWDLECTLCFWGF